MNLLIVMLILAGIELSQTDPRVEESNTPVRLVWSQTIDFLSLRFQHSCRVSPVVTFTRDSAKFTCRHDVDIIPEKSQCSNTDTTHILCRVIKQQSHLFDRLTSPHDSNSRLISVDWQRVDTSTLDADDVFQQDAFEVYDKTPITPLLPGTIELELYIHSFIVIDADFAWCQHCNSVRPTLALLAQKLKDIRILSANLVEHRELRHNLNYTCGEMCKLTVFNRETPNEMFRIPFEGNIADIERLLMLYRTNHFTNFTSEAELFNSLSDDKLHNTAVLGIFSNQTSEAFQIFAVWAKHHRHQYLVGFASAAMVDLQSDSIVLFQEKDQRKAILDASNITNATDLTLWADLHSTALVAEFSMEKESEFPSLNLPTAKIFVEIGEEEKQAALLESAALKYHGKLICTYLGSQFYPLAEEFGVDTTRFPAIGITMNRNGSERYVLERPKDKEEVESFVDSVMEGRIDPISKFRKPQLNLNTGSLSSVEEDTFDELLMRNDPMILVFYNDFSSSWKKAETIFNDTAYTLKNTKVKVCQYSLMQNQLPSMFSNLKVGHLTTYLLISSTSNPKFAFQRFKGKIKRTNLLSWVRRHVTEVNASWDTIQAEVTSIIKERTISREHSEQEFYQFMDSIQSLPMMKVSDGVFKHIIENGTGNLPGQYYTVSFHVVGTLPDGREFENTKPANDPFMFQLGRGQASQCWEKGISTMKLGEHAYLTCSGNSTFGSRPAIASSLDTPLRYEIFLFEMEPPRDEL
eukprot:gene6856-401_t